MKKKAETKFGSSFTVRLVVFILLNFGALYAGALFMGEGSGSDWYQELNKAPWTPPGWVFGAAWFTIMVCFSIYMAHVYGKSANQPRLLLIYFLHLVVNIVWNPTFFGWQQAQVGLAIIIALTAVVGVILFGYLKIAKVRSVLILPYFIWLLLATSLNAYIVFQN
jgi:tryptophan-rich sensory protein